MARLGLNDLVDDAVLDGFRGRHEEVAVGVLLDLGEGLVGVVGNVCGQQLLNVQDLLGLDFNVRGLRAE